MDNRSQEIQKEISTKVPQRKKLLIAVSGGIDSMVLMHAVNAIASSQQLIIEVAHVNHNLRPESSDDARFVAEHSAALGIECHCKELRLPQSAVSIEAWARAERYQYFSELLEQRRLDYCLTAHHANDLAETVLMRFLANREPSSIHSIDYKRKLIRPLLGFHRSELVSYAVHNRISFREDQSNSDIKYLRNRYRLEIIPYLEKQLGTDLIKSLAVRAIALEDDFSALEELARNNLDTLNDMNFGSQQWNRALRELLLSQPISIGWRIVERILAQRYGDFFGRRTSLRVHEFIVGADIAIEVPGGHRIERKKGGLAFL